MSYSRKNEPETVVKNNKDDASSCSIKLYNGTEVIEVDKFIDLLRRNYICWEIDIPVWENNKHQLCQFFLLLIRLSPNKFWLCNDCGRKVLLDVHDVATSFSSKTS